MRLTYFTVSNYRSITNAYKLNWLNEKYVGSKSIRHL